MKEFYYAYNNEALASCIFLSVFSIVEGLDVPRSCLILPFLLDVKTISYLKRNIANGELTLEEWMKQQPRSFVSFNKRYLSLLPVTLNSLMLLYKANQLTINNEKIISGSELDLDQHDLGSRFNGVNEVIPLFLSIIEKYSSVKLYEVLGVQL